jgi:acetate kinase
LDVAVLTSILVVNAGSSSLKLRLLGPDDAVLAQDDLGADAASSGALAAALERMRGAGPVDAVGHRVVHGGTFYDRPVRIDADVRKRLDELTALAPLHQPKSLAALDAVSTVLPDVPAAACFDTAFHAGMPERAAIYAVPREWQQRYGVRRYGFHGLSHAYCARRAAGLIGCPPERTRTVTCHLGAGASLAAVARGRGVDTTMGFTPLEGLVMATRSGSVDPGLVLWLEEHEHLSPREVAEALERRSGLLALAGTADMREVESRATAGDAEAVLALDVYVHRLVGAIAAMAAAAGGLDLLAFTGGVGEHSAAVRGRAAERLAFLGVRLDESRNAEASGDADIGAPWARVRTVVVTAREDLEVAAGTRAALA